MPLKKTSNLPRSVALQVTEACNLRCKMCYYWGETGCYSNAETSRKPEVLDFELLNPVLHFLSSVKPFYSLFGGEPLLYPQLEELILTVKGLGSIIDTPTNGTMLEEHASMLVRTGFDSVRVSIDGPREINDLQRGKGSFDKAMAGIETLYQEKLKNGKRIPIIDVIYTITPTNFLSIEQFFLEELNLSAIDRVSIQMENFLTAQMGDSYSNFLKSEFNITSERYWRGLLRSPDDFNGMNTRELALQVNKVYKTLGSLGKKILLLPPTFSRENLSAYLKADWDKMTDTYQSCLVPWYSVDITASGDLAPCHVYYDLTMGNLHEQSFEEIWNGDRYQKFREYMLQNKFMSICPGCCILYLAGRKLNKDISSK
ncbi:MAG: SPASM domain-containing protein [Candidatus Lokiarchaeota archaeon]|nr:SPASM domain-containing protein [Candidatus Lokiarchaeota archaeon]